MSNAIFPAGSALSTNVAWTSGNGRTIFRLQEDGNLVLYRDGNPTWQAPNAWGNGNTARMESDGNFVLYNRSMRSVWSSGTSGNNGAFLAVQDDGNLVIYSQDGNQPLWATNTGGQ
ncbi:hypothetical protein GCM10010493_72890 [Streptomyces lavendulae subsp. grasserius]